MNVLLPLEFHQTKYLSRQRDPHVKAFLALATDSLDPLDLRIRIPILDEIFGTCFATTEVQPSLWEQAFLAEIEKYRQRLGELQQENQAFLKTIQLLSNPQERERLMLTYLNALAKISLQSRSISADTKRSPWMDLDAVQEIFLDVQREFCIRLESLLLLASTCLKQADLEKQKKWRALLLEEFQKNQRWQTQLVCLKAAIRIPPCFPAQDDPWFLILPEYCAQLRDPLWLNAHAFDLWFALDPQQASLAAQRELSFHENPQHFFLRQHLVKRLEQQQCWPPLLQCLQNPDPSEMVMLQVITSLAPHNSEKLLPVLSENRYSLKLKAHALIQIVLFASADFSAECLLTCVAQIQGETPFVQIVLEEIHHWLKRNFPHHPQSKILFERLQEAETKTSIPRFQNLAVELSERILQYQLPYHLMLEEKLFSLLDSLPPGKKLKIRKTEIPLEPDLMGRHLTRYCARSFPVQIQETSKFWIFFRGAILKRSLWRFFHEMRTPSPEKRRTASHLLGHRALGTLRVPSPILSELSKTKVPGEHTYMELQGGWSPHVPTLEDFLSLFRSAWRGKTISIFTFRGITRLFGPQRHCFRFFLKMSWNYENLDQFRKRACENDQEMKEFQSHLLQHYGIRFFLEPYSELQQG